MSPTQWIVAVVVAAVLAFVVVLYNRLVQHRNLVREGWSGIDVQLRRRTDLVPNLVEAVQGYAAHERKLFEDITAERARSIAASTVPGQEQAERALESSLGRLIAVAEAYPDLKASTNFLELQRQLAEIEDHLQMARRYYNGAVRDMNIAIQSFPNNLVAGTFGFRPADYFELDDPAQAAAPSVAFQKSAR